MKPEVEKELEHYLTTGKEERVQFRARQETALQRIFNQLELHEAKDDSRFEMTATALKGLDARASKLENSVEDTGRHDLREVRSKLKEKEQFVNKIWQICIAAVVAAIVGAGAHKLFGGHG